VTSDGTAHLALTPTPGGLFQDSNLQFFVFESSVSMKYFEKMVTNFRIDVFDWRFVSNFCSQQFACVPTSVSHDIVRRYRNCHRSAVQYLEELPVLRLQQRCPAL
jgi:hypothetical protein